MNTSLVRGLQLFANPSLKKAWIFSRKQHLLFFWLPLPLCYLLSLHGNYHDLEKNLLVYWLIYVFVDLGHLLASGFPVYLSGRFKWKKQPVFLATPLGVAAVSVILYNISVEVFRTVLAYLVLYHILAQQQGWLSLSKRGYGESETDYWFDKIVLWTVMLVPVVFWNAGLSSFAPNYFHDSDLLLLPLVWTNTYFELYAAVIGAFVGRQLWQLYHKGQVNLAKISIVGSTALWFGYGLIVAPHNGFFWLVLITIHGIPYIYFCYQNSWQKKNNLDGHTSAKWGLIAFLSIIVAICLTHNLITRVIDQEYLYLLVPLAWSVNFSHYFFDAVIWRRSLCKKWFGES